MNLELITAPAVEPVTLTEAKLHCRVTGTDQDNVITALIIAAREMAESICRRALITQTWKVYIDQFSMVIDLPLPPIQSVSSVTYTDETGASQTVSSSIYEVDTIGGRILLGYSQTWPSPRLYINSVQAQYVAGYGDTAADVPQPIKQAMLMLIGHWYENREVSAPIQITNVPMAADRLLSSYRWITF